MFKYIFQDWKANKYSAKGRIVLLSYRLTSLVNQNKILRLFFFPCIFVHKFIFYWIIGIEININAKIGANCQLFHGQALVINGGTIIGNDAILRNSITIGTKLLADGTNSSAPQIGNFVNIGSNSVIIGPIKIGDNVSIGAGSVVVKDFPNNCIIAGNPAIIIKKIG